MSNAVYDPKRINILSKVIPAIYDSVDVGDEVQMGMLGDPANVYRGADVPTGHIVKMEGSKPYRSVTIALEDGTHVQAHEDVIAPKHLFDLTERGYRGVIDREETVYRNAQEAKRIEEVRLRGVAEAEKAAASTASLQASISSLRDEMYRNSDKVKTSLRKEVADLRNTTVRSLELLQKEMHIEHGEARYGSLLMDEINVLKGQASRPASPRALTRSDSFSSQASSVSV